MKRPTISIDVIRCLVACCVLAALAWGAVSVMRVLTYHAPAIPSPTLLDVGAFVRIAEQHRNDSPQAFLAFRERNEGVRIRTEAFVKQAAIGEDDEGKPELHLVIASSMDAHGRELVSASFPGWPKSLPPRNDDLPNGVYPCDRIVLEGTIGMVNSIGAIFTDCKVIKIYEAFQK